MLKTAAVFWLTKTTRNMMNTALNPAAYALKPQSPSSWILTKVVLVVLEHTSTESILS